MTVRSRFAWWLAALAFGAGFVLLGWAIAAVLGLVSPVAACVVSVIVVFLGGGGLAGQRIGGAAGFASFIGLTATIGLAFEGYQAIVLRRAHLHEVTSLEAWPTGADAVHGPRLLHERELAVSKTWRTDTKSSTSYTMEVVPLVAEKGGPVLAFACRASRDAADDDGAYLVRWASLHPEDGHLCETPMSDAVTALDKAGRPIARGAPERVVRVFASESRMRSAADLTAAFKIPLVFLAFYVVGITLHARKVMLTPPKA